MLYVWSLSDFFAGKGRLLSEEPADDCQKTKAAWFRSVSFLQKKIVQFQPQGGMQYDYLCTIALQKRFPVHPVRIVAGTARIKDTFALGQRMDIPCILGESMV